MDKSPTASREHAWRLPTFHICLSGCLGCGPILCFSVVTYLSLLNSRFCVHHCLSFHLGQLGLWAPQSLLSLHKRIFSPSFCPGPDPAFWCPTGGSCTCACKFVHTDTSSQCCLQTDNEGTGATQRVERTSLESSFISSRYGSVCPGGWSLPLYTACSCPGSPRRFSRAQLGGRALKKANCPGK